MKKMTLLLAGAVAFALACSDSSPTSPELSSSAATARVESTTVGGAAGAQRPSSRTVGLRSSPAQPLQAVWGGQHIAVMVAASGASVEYDCAFGEIDAPFVTNATGQFDLPGTYWSYPPGPISANWLPEKRPARYLGVTDGKTMSLTVRLGDNDNEFMQFTLARDMAPHMVHCL